MPSQFWQASPSEVPCYSCFCWDIYSNFHVFFNTRAVAQMNTHQTFLKLHNFGGNSSTAPHIVISIAWSPPHFRDTTDKPATMESWIHLWAHVTRTVNYCSVVEWNIFDSFLRLFLWDADFVWNWLYWFLLGSTDSFVLFDNELSLKAMEEFALL